MCKGSLPRLRGDSICFPLVLDLLSSDVIEAVHGGVRAELLRRLGDKPAFAECWVDEELRNVTAPLNERTASKSAVALPRGSRIAVPSGKIVRLFLH